MSTRVLAASEMRPRLIRIFDMINLTWRYGKNEWHCMNIPLEFEGDPEYGARKLGEVITDVTLRGAQRVNVQFLG